MTREHTTGPPYDYLKAKTILGIGDTVYEQWTHVNRQGPDLIYGLMRGHSVRGHSEVRILIPDLQNELKQIEGTPERIRRRLTLMRDIVLLAETNPTINDLLKQLEETYQLVN